MLILNVCVTLLFSFVAAVQLVSTGVFPDEGSNPSSNLKKIVLLKTTDILLQKPTLKVEVLESSKICLTLLELKSYLVI